MTVDTMGPVVLILLMIVLVATVRPDPSVAERRSDDSREPREPRPDRGRSSSSDPSRSGRRRRISI